MKGETVSFHWPGTKLTNMLLVLALARVVPTVLVLCPPAFAHGARRAGAPEKRRGGEPCEAQEGRAAKAGTHVLVGLLGTRLGRCETTTTLQHREGEGGGGHESPSKPLQAWKRYVVCHDKHELSPYFCTSENLPGSEVAAPYHSRFRRTMYTIPGIDVDTVL